MWLFIHPQESPAELKTILSEREADICLITASAYAELLLAVPALLCESLVRTHRCEASVSGAWALGFLKRPQGVFTCCQG